MAPPVPRSWCASSDGNRQTGDCQVKKAVAYGARIVALTANVSRRDEGRTLSNGGGGPAREWRSGGVPKRGNEVTDPAPALD